ncbi:MAG: recombinase family protein [Candidatus Babeliaceae bacterium]
MNAVIIARVSTEEQKEAGLSLPAQVARLEKYCQNKHFNIIKSCSFDESAYTDQRDEFDGIIDFVLKQKEKVVICFDKVDRLTRGNIFDVRVSALYEKALRDEVELHFISDGQIINSQISATQKFQFSISLGLAKYYSDAISDNVKRANEQKLRRGEWTSKAPFGYKNIRLPDEKKDIIVDEHLSYIITKAFELYATSAYSMKLLLEKLKDDYGVTWSKGYIDKLLNNHFYYGMMVVKSKMYPHKYPPLITKTLFDQVQAVKGGFNKKKFKYAGLPYMYRGLLRCGDCGLSITPERQKGHVYYHCTQYNGKHDAKWFREEEITEQLGQVFKKLQLPDNIMQLIIGTLNEVHQDKIEFHNKHFDELTKKQKELTTMMDRLYLDKLKGRITDEHYDRFYLNLRDQMNDTNDRLAQLQEAEDNYYVTARYLLDISNKAYDLFISSEVEEKRQLIKLVLQNLRIEGENVLYDAHKPFDLLLTYSVSQLWRP